MPELPEVQTTVNDLLALNICGRTLRQVKVFWCRSADGVSSTRLNKMLVRRSIKQITRQGKYIVFHLKPAGLFIIHLRMSGRIRYELSSVPREKHEHVIIGLDNGFDIRFYDPRKFGRLYTGKKAISQMANLGFEPLSREFTCKKFANLLKTRRRQIKPLLLDQTVLAGLGNIYSDEALWYSGIHPLRASCSLTQAEIRSLYRAIRAVLRKGICYFGTSLGEGESNFISTNRKRGRNRIRLKMYGRTGEKCLRCRSIVRRIIVAQRSTHICPHCQHLSRT